METTKINNLKHEKVVSKRKEKKIALDGVFHLCLQTLDDTFRNPSIEPDRT